jgi:hypothetical protein
MELAYRRMLVGIVVRGVPETILGFVDAPVVDVAVFTASALEVLGIVSFFLNLLPRIARPREEMSKSSRSRARTLGDRCDRARSGQLRNLQSALSRVWSTLRSGSPSELASEIPP